MAPVFGMLVIRLIRYNEYRRSCLIPPYTADVAVAEVLGCLVLPHRLVWLILDKPP